MEAEIVSLQQQGLEQGLQELEKVEQDIARFRKERGIEFFVPNHPQLHALQSPARTVVYAGGNRAGKSTTGAAFLTAHLTHNYRACACHGEWFAPAKRYHRPIKAVIVATEFPIIERVIEPKLMSLLPTNWFHPNGLKRTPQGYLRRLSGVDGSTVDILSAEMDQLAFEGADWDLAWIDEPTPRAKYTAILRGLLDRQGLILLTFTPLIEPWMKGELVDKADGKTIAVITADTYANTEDIHGHPILPREAIAQFEAMIPEEERATRIHGQFFHLKGVVYKEYLPGIHDRAWDYQYPDPVIAVLDPHTRKPHWVIWAFLNRMDQLFVDRELVFNGTLKELQREILLTEQRAGYKMRKRLIDPNYGRWPSMPGGGRTVIEELAQKPFPLRFLEANDQKEEGILKVKTLLHFDRTRQLSFTNMPQLYFHTSRASQTIHSIRNYQYGEWKGKTRFERDPKEEAKQLDTDGADCVRYLCMSNPTFDRMSAQTIELEEPVYA